MGAKGLCRKKGKRKILEVQGNDRSCDVEVIPCGLCYRLAGNSRNIFQDQVLVGHIPTLSSSSACCGLHFMQNFFTQCRCPKVLGFAVLLDVAVLSGCVAYKSAVFCCIQICCILLHR